MKENMMADDRHRPSRDFKRGRKLPELLSDSILSVDLIFLIIEPFFELLGVFGKLFILVTGAVVLVVDVRFRKQLGLLLALVVYIILIVLFNGVDSLRLGALTAIMIGLLISKAKMLYSFIPIYVATVGYVLFDITEGFTNVVVRGGKVAEGSSINYFAQVLFLIFLFGILGDRDNRSRLLALVVLITTVLVSLFVPSRQLLIVIGSAAIYFILGGRYILRKIILSLAVAIIFSVFIQFDVFPVYERFIREGGSDPGRAAILDCYLSKYNVTDLFIGSDTTEAGNCAMINIGFRSLSLGYLETLGQLGLLGFIMVVFYPMFVIYFALTKNTKYFYALLFAAIYQFAEPSFMWLYFAVIFVLHQQLLSTKRKYYVHSIQQSWGPAATQVQVSPKVVRF